MWQVGFWLIVIVIGNKIFHCVLREQRFELRVELGREGLVVCHHQGGALYLHDYIGDSESLACTRGAFEHLMAIPLL
ncbi:MAG: hypothetical protein BWY63_01306 [Chloroflexi bacterium ADurb.Bin360]|nr:MAG: hypothetical protein BWY63_01306 [Chloroflexi bacterium ADurb.Bin360]